MLLLLACLLGFAASKRPDLFAGLDALRAALERLSPPAAREVNLTALNRGWNSA